MAIKKSKKELLEEAQNANDVAVADQVVDVVAYADENAIAVDTASLSHYAVAEAAVVGASIATDVAVDTAVIGTAATVGGMSLGTIALGTLAAVGGVAAAANGGGDSGIPTDTESITYYSVMIHDEITYYNDGSVSNVEPAQYVNIGKLSGGKDITDMSSLSSQFPVDFIGFDAKSDSGVNELTVNLSDVLSYGFHGTDENDVEKSFFAVIGGSEDIVDVDLENWTDEGIETINDGGSLNGNYHIYTTNGAELMILEGMQII